MFMSVLQNGVKDLEYSSGLVEMVLGLFQEGVCWRSMYLMRLEEVGGRGL